MQTLTVIIGILLFLALIAIHEFGHFTMAKLFHIRVYEFAIGMGPILMRKERGGTVYSLRAIPLGGFCNFDSSLEDVDTDDLEEIREKRSQDPQNLANQPAWAKILVLLGGPLFNILFAIAVISGTLFVFNKTAVSLWTCFKEALLITGIYFVTILQFLASLFHGTAAGGEVTGVVGIVQTISEQAHYGMVNLIYLIGVLSINLGIMNLLPIPALDGGRILFTLIRKISRGKFTEEAEMWVNGIGMILLLALMVFLIVKDTFRLLG